MSRLRPFVGRVAQLTALEEALAAAILGRGGAVVLTGEPGIGKTRLAGELSDRAERRGARVLWARCAADSQAPPYWPFAQILEALYGDQDPARLQQRFGAGADDAAQLFLRRLSARAAGDGDEAARAPLSDQQRFRLFDTITAMLLYAAGKRPLVLVFDDVHAADPACLHLLVFLARSLRSSAVLVVATLRDAESRRDDLAPILLGSLAREASTLGLDGWDRDEVGAFLAHDGSHAAAAPVVDAVHRASAGNPFFVGEIARLLGGDARPDNAESIPVPARVRQALLSRLADSPVAVQTAMAAASILGLSFDTRTVAAISGLAAEETAAALAEAVTAGFLERRGDSAWSFRHEIARDVLYETDDAPSRRRGHLLAASELSGRGRPSEAVAHHLLAALPDGDLDDALDAVLAAAEAAVRAMAYENAVRWLQRGLAALSEHSAGTQAGSAGAAGLRAGADDAAWRRRELHGRL
ncbi:MAG: AAA family ATPase, partial [Candidatus Binatia bacterium]